MRKKKRGTLLKVLLLVFAIYSAVTLISLQIQIDAKNKELSVLKNQIKQQTQKNGQIQSQLESELTDEQIARIAREKLGYVFPDERIYINVPGN